MLPKKYQSTPEAIASFDYVDIVDGTGVRVFYAADLSGASILTPNTLYSRLGWTRAGPNDKTTATFDVSFNNPVVIKGNVKVNIPTAVNNQSGGAAGAIPLSGSAYLYHYDGTTETLIGSAIDSWTVGAGLADNGWAYHTYAFGIDVAQREFKKGETFRVKSTVDATAGGALIPYFMGNDPKGRTDIPALETGLIEVVPNWPTTQQTIHIPFLLNI